ncbi:hypothetical protein Agabi119p4_3320 [Agaricus bisporus var. burnettii]|uniref:Uncharacterized protein n=1 Tax=Agaricus bisporus var. burnettii TaxID=192524 RepID=A0A8H7F6Z6_AGABI|nr:hypothetical protein Agabi119p4_3320 [Agaricus bisporus var. burnettii]
MPFWLPLRIYLDDGIAVDVTDSFIFSQSMIYRHACAPESSHAVVEFPDDVITHASIVHPLALQRATASITTTTNIQRFSYSTRTVLHVYSMPGEGYQVLGVCFNAGEAMLSSSRMYWLTQLVMLPGVSRREQQSSTVLTASQKHPQCL